MFAANVCQLLEVEGVGEEGAEPLHGRVVAALGEFAPLTVVPGYTVQLSYQTQKDASADDDICHKNSFTL